MCFGKKGRVGAQFPNVEPALVPTTRKDAITQQPITSPLPKRPYTYESLENGFIRLLKIQPAAGQNTPLRATLVHEKLVETGESQRPTYEALSYCWGANVFSQKLYLPTGVLNITNDLASALIRLRRIDAERILWVDQCCINQKNGEEIERQVSMMDQIYKNAVSTIIWLGEETAHTRQALDAIQIAADRYGFQSTKVREIYDRPWFTRVWV
ncbi:heterokaryon incompatibility protein-domain-containing protein, partial [Pyrenochaeta sp. MPI-SDFR-AT-0127]